jgi:hypothetical protein
MICQRGVAPTLENSGMLLEAYDLTCFFVHSRAQLLIHIFSFVSLARSNFLGTKFTIFDGQPPHAGAKITKSRSTRLVNSKQVSPRVPAGNYPVARISYELNVLGSR